ncbi:MAG: hypothetical protein KKB31_02620, partial [Nanoarchaeota archaeon]|nr:hypothetical protein [Nanoarchaeota archaeon]
MRRGRYFRSETFVTYSVIVLLLAFGIGALYLLGGGGFTGFAVFNQNAQVDFDEGTYVNTVWNGSAVVLDSATSGSYTSKVFDGGADSYWNNLSYVGGMPSLDFLFAVDGAGDVYKSLDSGQTWAQTVDNYGRTSDTAEMFSDNSYLYIIAQSNQEVWISDNLGVGFSVINDTFANSGLLVAEGDSSGNLFVVDASGDVYLSSDNGGTWTLQGDFNGVATNNAKGIGIDSSDNLYVVDGSGAVWRSVNSGVDWTAQNSSYGGGAGTDDLELDSNGNLYILNTRDVLKSINEGVTWIKINDSFAGYDGSRMF